MHIVLPLHTKDGAKSKPFCWTQSSHVRQVGYIPKYDILLLDSLIVFIIRELPTDTEAPGNVFTHIGATNRHIKIGELISFAIAF